jgi:hypothetical protein
MWTETLAYIQAQRSATTPFDAVNGGKVPDANWHAAGDVINPFAEVGVTWWIEDISPWRFGHSWEIQWRPEFTRQMDELIRRGPPRM